MFCERLKQKRQEKGLTQIELAKRVGISRDLYNKYERAGIRPSYEILISLAEELDTTIDFLISGKALEPITPQPPSKPTLEAFLAQEGITNDEYVKVLHSIIQLMKKGL